jgi:hypothetical protein
MSGHLTPADFRAMDKDEKAGVQKAIRERLLRMRPRARLAVAPRVPTTARQRRKLRKRIAREG